MRGLASVLTIAFVFASSALLVGPASAQSSSSGTVDGFVCATPSYWYQEGYSNSTALCDYYGNNLPSATVYLSQPGLPLVAFNESETSDQSGHFSFSGVPAGTYTLTAVRTGFATESASVEVSSGKLVRKDLMLDPKDITITGSVSSSGDGDPLSDAIVSACCDSSGMQDEDTTGSDGKFAIDTKAGWLSLNARRSGYIEQGRYELFDGSAPVTFVLDPIPPQDAKLHGVVRDQDGAPVSGVGIYVSNYGQSCCYAMPYEGDAAKSSMPYPYYGGQNWTTTDAQGAYAIHVYSGENSLQVGKEGYAGFSLSVHVDSGQDKAQDLTIKKFPEKTARIEGRVVDSRTGAGLRYASISVQSPEFGVYECSVEASQARSASDAPATSSGTYDSAGASMYYPGPYYDPGCRIIVHPDGRFEGTVTPGYAVISVYYNSYLDCSESHDADGSSTRTCGPEYNSWSRSLQLAPDATTDVRVPLRAKSPPDATVSGYLVDGETGDAIPGAQISFYSEERQSSGYATTDGDGSYKLRLRSGYHSVSVYANGYLHWQGVLDVKAGESPFDVELTPGFESYGGGCCYPYPMAARSYDMAASSGGYGTTYAMTATSSPEAAGGPSSMDAGLDSEGSSNGSDFEDLGGGLGPYDADKRAKFLAGDDPEVAEDDRDGGVLDIPAPGLLMALAALGAVLVLARRRLV